MDTDKILKFCLAACKGQSVRMTRTFISLYIKHHFIGEEEAMKLKRSFDEHIESLQV